MTPQSNPTPWQPPAGRGYASPHLVRFTAENVAIVAAGVMFLLGAQVLSLFVARNADSRREALLWQQGVDTAAVITRMWHSSGGDRHMVSYRFTAEKREWSGEASAPPEIWTSLQPGAPLAIRYVRGWPRLNHPAEWAASHSLGWLPRLKVVAQRKPFLLRLDAATHEALQRWADADLRSLNGQIEFLLRRALVDSGRWKPAPDAPPWSEP